MKNNKNGLSATTIQVNTPKPSRRGRTPDGAPNPIDVHVGSRIRLRRTLLGLSQEQLAKLLGLTFQQLQKYERGINRIGASRLWDIGNILKVPVSFFFEEMDKETAEQSPRMFALPNAQPTLFKELELTETDPLQRAESIELVKAYYKISNRKAAHHLFDLMIAMSKMTTPNDEK
nr:MAG TPA: helix-turn-helix domain protein [Caudoviricetes sp.]